MERNIPRISEVLYVGLCHMIGTPTQVKIRRDIMDSEEMIYKPVFRNRKGMVLKSGSKREGFRLKTSDIDNMLWPVNVIVICDLSQVPPYHPDHTLVLMEYHGTPPGFARLQLLTQVNNPYFRQCFVDVNDQIYISSSLYREVLYGIGLELPSLRSHYQSAAVHGPCTSGTECTEEFDDCYCFSCQHWPPPASQWINRCQVQCWPSSQVLQDIISNGCHLVAIGSGRSTSTHQCETEWRMSFSVAEYKLVSAMNHTQFLCYGLLKIFLKEVLNVGIEVPLLCSYFIKTTLFWKIQGNTISVWCSQNILHCVWVCFKYLTQCVYRGEFPNFFIPLNNMFLNKIRGAAQKQLFLQLLNLYNMGFSCLLLSPSLYQILNKTILNPRFHVSTDKNNIISEVMLDRELFTEISNINTSKDFDLDECFICMKNIDEILKTMSSPSQYHMFALNVIRNTFLVHIAFRLDERRQGITNTIDNTPLDMLIAAAESGCISDALYVAMYLYNNGKYMEALYYKEKSKQKLCTHYVLDILTEKVNRDEYMKAVGGQSLLAKFRKAVSCMIALDKYCFIEELRLELRVGYPVLIVPPLVMTHMLSFLCHHRLGDEPRSTQSLEDLHTLLHYHDGQNIPFQSTDISWQILGICEQIHGDKESANYSYQKSLEQYPIHKIQFASWTRMQSIISK